MTGFEPATSWSQTTRATNCATSRSEKIFDFSVCSLSGQICGQKFFAETHGGEKTSKREKNGAFTSFRRSAYEAVTRSQTSRATSCATTRYDILHLHIIAFFCAYVKSKNRKRMFRFFCSEIGKHNLFIETLHLFRFKIYKTLYK